MMSDAVDDLFSAFSTTSTTTGKSGRLSNHIHDGDLTGSSRKRSKTVVEEDIQNKDDLLENCPQDDDNDVLEEVIIETYEADHNCLHECVRPKVQVTTSDDSINGTEDNNATFSKHVSLIENKKAAAREFPYTLDPFQSTAVRCLEAGESVLVSAHTSAGKTTVAEYAIAMGLRDKQRVIYTSPIKALSNQKYRDLSNMYGNEVGLLTGDVSLNPSASVVIMTTEILRSMLYRGSEMVREMKWVIFDEIHYMRDRDRGVVWEETIILLPDTVRLVFLSATIPNAREFAEWICRIKHQPCHVIYTDYRPVPLQHYLFPAGGEGVHLVMDEKKVFKEDNFHKAVAELTKASDNLATDTKTKQVKKNSKNDIEKIVLMCHERHYTPVIVFAFSKREVESNALGLKTIKLTSVEEEELIEIVFNNAMETLGEDRHLPQITCMLPLLKRGIGLHHGGLLPIVKEVIEILFQESLIKVLFSTETFSMGVNMPAKTVVFTKLKKWDGTSFRMISPGEYIQMSGRAGRRGLDDRGLTIIMFDEQLEPDVAKDLFLGDPLRIESQFHLGYNMLLNLLRVEGANPEYMIQRSFFQFQQDKATLQLEDKKRALEIELESLEDLSFCVPDKNMLPKDIDINNSIAEYFAAKHKISMLTNKLRDIIMQPKYVLRFLQVGRVVSISDIHGQDWGLGIIAEPVQKERPIIKRDFNHGSSHIKSEEPQFSVNVVLLCDPSSVQQKFQSGKLYKPCQNESEGIWEMVPCTLHMLKEVTQVVANVPENIKQSPEARAALGAILKKISDQLQGQFPILDPVEHMKIDAPVVQEILKDVQQLEHPILNNPLHSHSLLPILHDKFEEKVKLNTKRQELEQQLESKKHLVIKDDLRAMRRVLRKLEYLNNNDVVTLKGRAACEVSSVDELVMTELLFQNVFHKMDNDYLVAMLSCFVFEEKSDDSPPSDPKLLMSFEKVRTVARRVAEVSVESKLPIVVNDYVDKFKPVLMEIVLKWMGGCKFADLGISEDLFEGSVVRAMRRLEELLRQLASAAKCIGEEELESRISQAVVQMRRGIVFSASLYL